MLDYDKFLEELSSQSEKLEKINKSKSEIFKSATNSQNNMKKIIIHEKQAERSDSKSKRKIKKKNSTKRSSNVYDIDNFIIQNNAIRIHQRHTKLDIPIPVYKEIRLDEDELDKSDEEQVN